MHNNISSTTYNIYKCAAVLFCYVIHEDLLQYSILVCVELTEEDLNYVKSVILEQKPTYTIQHRKV